MEPTSKISEPLQTLPFKHKTYLTNMPTPPAPVLQQAEPSALCQGCHLRAPPYCCMHAAQPQAAQVAF